MQFTASHRFDHPFHLVAAAFLSPDAHVGRYELSGAGDVQVLRADVDEGRLDLQTLRTVEGEVPAFAQKLVAPTNTITTTDRWELVDGTVRGTARIEASNVPGTATVTAVIETDGADACTYAVVLDLALTVPLIGDRFVKLLRPKVMEIIDAEFAGWDAWLAGEQR